MKKKFVWFGLCFFVTTNMLANDLILSKTGNAQLDGIYKPFVELNGAMSFIKNTQGITFKIERFKWSTDKSVVFGWIISDSNNNEYFAVTDESVQIPSQGWDVARAGVGLNVNFDLTFTSTDPLEATDLTLTNTPSLDVKVYPNPTVGVITIEAQNLQNVSLVSASGEILSSGTNNRLDLSDLPSGIYNLVILANEVKTVKRIVKR
jgi:Secretion system C-terminal sorting domain